jgi:hypothetical protein
MSRLRGARAVRFHAGMDLTAIQEPIFGFFWQIPQESFTTAKDSLTAH